MGTYQQLEQVARNWMNEIWVKRDFSKFDQIHHTDFRDFKPCRQGKRSAILSNGYRGVLHIFPGFQSIH